MKQEVKDIIVQAAASSPTTLWALMTRVTIAEWVAIILGVIQAAVLIRRWWREETEWGLKLKRWAGRPVKAATAPVELDE